MAPEHLKIETFGKNGVRITYIPTNEFVSCNFYKSQPQNKEFCLKMLQEKIEKKV